MAHEDFSILQASLTCQYWSISTSGLSHCHASNPLFGAVGEAAVKLSNHNGLTASANRRLAA